MSKTRNQRKRVRVIVRVAVNVVVCVAAGLILGQLFRRALDHPAEQHISGSEYMAEIAQYAPEQRAMEIVAKELPDAAELEALVRAAEMATLYDVPLDAQLQFYIIGLCEEHNIDPAIVMAMIWRESRFHADSVGDGGNSFGLMQIQPRWHSGRMKKLGCEDLLDPYQNVVVGIDYLAESIDRYDGNIAKALVAYNQGSYKGTVTAYAKAVLDGAERIGE